MPPSVWYSYAAIRVVPRPERGEFVNAGVVLFARTLRYLEARVELDRSRLLALAPGLDLAPIERHLASFVAIAAAAPDGGPIAALSPSERFHWLTAPRSTVVQPSPVHIGRCTDPRVALEDLLAALVRPLAG